MKIIYFSHFIFSVSFLSLVFCDFERDYSGYQVYKIKHSHNSKLLQNYILKYEDQLDVLNVNKNLTHILSPPSLQSSLEYVLNNLQINYTKDGSIQQKILSEKIRRRSEKGGDFFDDSQPLENIHKFVENLVQKYPNIVDYFVLGETYEGNNIGMIVISKDQRPKPKLMFIQAGLHAREWAAPSTALYFVKFILENYKDYEKLLEDVEINIVPVANPDGYEYSYKTDRMWRKNREPNFDANGQVNCIGTDLNRNYGYAFMAMGSSSNPCSDVYAGQTAFSAKETALLAGYLGQNRDRLMAYVDLHSYGSYIFYPFGHKRDTFYRKNLHATTAAKIADAIKSVRGTNYEIDTAANLIYESGGGSDDYAAGILQCPLVFTLELPNDDFIIDRDDIKPIGNETSLGLLEILKVVSNLNEYNDDEE